MGKHTKLVSAKTGLMPGTALYVGDKPPNPTEIIVHFYDAQGYSTANTYDAAEIAKAINSGRHVWIDISGLNNNELIYQICQDHNIHPLVIEDMLNTKQRPKLDIIEDYLFIVFKLLESPSNSTNFSTEQFSLLIKQNFLITVRESNNYKLNPLYDKLKAEHSLVREHGSDYLTYLIMDFIIDGYFNFVEETGLLLEKSEDILIKNPESIQLQNLYTIKRKIQTLRKTISPLRDIVHLLLGEHGVLINNRYNLYFRDLHDHSIRLLESIDLQREMSASMLDIYLSTLNNRMNETMKILTLFASIFIPLTFIVGVYGMNFEYMPELSLRYGYPMILTFMVLVVVVMLYYFKRKKLF